MEHVFISFASRDGQPQATQLYVALRASPVPIDAWLMRADDRAGSWRKQIDEKIRTCAALVVVLTSGALESDEVEAEWVRAKSYKKQIIPLRFQPGLAPPFGLDIYQAADFTRRFDHGLAQLQSMLFKLNTPEGRVAELEQRMRAAERDIGLGTGEFQRRAGLDYRDAETELRELTGSGARSGSPPLTPASVGAQVLRTINLPPTSSLGTFQDRVSETARVGEFLDDPGARLLTVVGRAGVGKTAMVCRALDQISCGDALGPEPASTAFEGIVYLGEGPSASRGISFAHFYDDIARLFPGETRTLADRGWREATSTSARFNTLLSLLGGRAVIVLLDNFEAVIDPATGTVADAELAELLRLLLLGPDHCLKVVVTTQEAARDLVLLVP